MFPFVVSLSVILERMLSIRAEESADTQDQACQTCDPHKKFNLNYAK